MKRNLLFLFALCLFGMGTMQAQNVKVTVTAQSVSNASQDAVFAVGENGYQFTSGPTVTMKSGNNALMSHPGTVTIQLSEASVTGPSLTFNPNANGYATLCSSFALKVPSGVKVYAPTYDAENSSLKLNSDTQIEKESIINPGVGLILKKEDADKVSFAAVSESETSTQYTSALTGVTDAKEVTSQTVYTLGRSNLDGTVGFYKFTGESVRPFSAYLQSSSNAKSVLFSLGEDEATSIDCMQFDEQSVSAIYNLNGQRVKSGTKGILIVNGKKVFNK